MTDHFRWSVRVALLVLLAGCAAPPGPAVPPHSTISSSPATTDPSGASGQPEPGHDIPPSVADRTTRPRSTTPAPTTPAPEGLPSEWGIAFFSPGGEVTVLGTVREEAAWSTIKVPLALAALRNQGEGVSELVHAALSWSDNAAAAGLWTGLGVPEAAGAAVDEVLRGLGDTHTMTQTRQVRPPFSAFGQTSWALEGQIRTARGLSCAGDATARAVLASMADVVPDQAWGLGQLDGARFKGGWGPGPDGRYLVRQFGLVPINGRDYPVALAARADDGTLASGTAALDVLAAWWAESLAEQSAPARCAGEE